MHLLLPTVLLAAPLLVAGLAACQSDAQQQTVEDAAAVDTTAIIAAIDSIRAAYEEAYEAGDFETAASVPHAEMIYSPPGRPPIQGRDSIVTYEREMRPPGATVDLEPIDLRVIGAEWAYEFGTATLIFTPEGAEEPQSVESTYLAVFRKTPDGWKTYRESISSNQPPPGGS